MASHGRTLDIIKKKRTRHLVDQAVGPHDEVRFVLYGTSKFAFVALQDRVIIARYGVTAGASFGGRISQFRYEDILNVNISTGMISGVIEIHTAAHQASSVGDYWKSLATSGSGTSKSPFEADNAYPTNKGELKEWQPYLDELQGYIRLARTAPSSSPQRETQPPDLGDQLKKISDLHASGVLSDEEFVAAKARLLNG